MTGDLGMISILITTCASAVVAVIAQIQHSRCEKISLCCGMFSCTRSVPDITDEHKHIVNNSQENFEQEDFAMSPLTPVPGNIQ